jgi:hypothetical protein
VNFSYRYPVLKNARDITQDEDLDILEMRTALGIPLANDIRRWLAEQPPMRRLCLDFLSVRAITLSVAEEVGPVLMQVVQQSDALEHRYPVYALNTLEPAYTFARAFANANWTGLVAVPKPAQLSGSILTVAADKAVLWVVIGDISSQMAAILALAEQRFRAGKSMTSEDLKELDFMAGVGPAARSKRLTELYSRRLLAFRENPQKPRERLFIPAWRLEP